MVKNPGKASSSGPIRALNRPMPITVEEDKKGKPVTVSLGRKKFKVIAVQDVWEIDEEWWRPKPVARVYYKIALEGDRSLTVFRDRSTGEWYRQRYE